MTVLTIDIETTVKNAEGVSALVVGDDKASPFHPENKAVLVGYRIGGTWTSEDGKDEYPYDVECFGEDSPDSAVYKFLAALNRASVLVGQNIRFDMHYLHQTFPQWESKWLHNPNNRVWDTQLAEYLLTAQQHKYASLDELAVKYGGTLKDSRIKDYWEAGVQTEDIPHEELAEYLKADVENTYLVYIKQLELAEMTGMLPLIESQMRALVATWEMSKNGMCFDYWRAVDMADKLQQEIDAVQASIQPYIDSRHPEAAPGAFSITSNDVLSRLLFGGAYKYYREEDTGVVFKTGKRAGQAKTRRVELEGNVAGLFPPRKEWATKKAGTYQVGDEVVKYLASIKSAPAESRELLAVVTKIRALTKDRNTYFVGFSQLAWPTQGPSGPQYFIHGKLNHCSTDTGRLSSSSPNMQNLSNKSRED